MSEYINLVHNTYSDTDIEKLGVVISPIPRLQICLRNIQIYGLHYERLGCNVRWIPSISFQTESFSIW